MNLWYEYIKYCTMWNEFYYANIVRPTAGFYSDVLKNYAKEEKQK